MIRRLTVCAVMGLLVMPASAAAQITDAADLEGLPGVWVLWTVLRGEPRSDSLGLTHEVVQTLREAGVPVLESDDPEPRPVLAVTARTLEIKDDTGTLLGFTYTLQLQLVEAATVRGRTLAVASWGEPPRLGVASVNSIGSVLRDQVRSAAGRFARDYLAANPRPGGE